MKMTFRSLLTGSLCLAVASLILPSQSAQAAVGKGPSFKGPLGLQLYSLRDQFKTDVPGTLALVKELGFRNVELAGTYDMTPEEFRSLLKEYKLKPIAGHFSYDLFKNDPESVAQQAKELGLKYAGCAWIPHQGDFTEQTCREVIKVFNYAGEALKKHGIKFFYHQHGYEFQPYGDGTLMDLLIQETNPKTVVFEMDILWTVFPGQDPVALLEKYGKRWELMHLKDLRLGVETGSLSGHTDVRNDVALGTGQMDMPAILKAAKKAGVKYYFIEDESPSVKEQLPVSVEFLEVVSFK